MSFRFYFFFVFLSVNLFGQKHINIRVLDTEKNAISGMLITNLSGTQSVITDRSGLAKWVYTYDEIVEINLPGWEKKQFTIINQETNDWVLAASRYELPMAEVVSNWVNENSFVVHTTLTATTLNQKQIVQDVPLLLQHLPSSVVTSDAGNGVGYSGIRIRGLDPSQINVLVNGIPFNDAESQGVFWVDMPDIIASASAIQVQRGIGLSGSGQVAFGSSILINTNKFDVSPFVKFETGVGSFGTYKTNVEFGSGQLKDNWNVRSRISRIYSDGFIERAFSSLWSGNVSVSKITADRSLQLHLFDGLEKTYQAWYGVPVQFINGNNRRYNPAGTEKTDSPYDNQIDRYRQTHIQVLHSERLGQGLSFNNTLHYTPGYGYYEEFKADQNPEEYKLAMGSTVNIVRRKILHSDFYGSIHSLQYNRKNISLDAGISWNTHLGNHIGKVIKINNETLGRQSTYYDFDAKKTSMMGFGKLEYEFKNLSILADMQIRHIKYSYDHVLNDTHLTIKHNFFNPKLGLTYSVLKNLQLFAFSGIAHREPNREEYVRADKTIPLAEKLIDYEMGIRIKNKHIAIEQNFYYMYYKNQLIPTGKLNEVGAYIRSNVPVSYRLGSETNIQYQANEKLGLNLNFTLSTSSTKMLNESIDNWDTGLQETKVFKNQPIAYSPNVISNFNVNYYWVKNKKYQLLSDFTYQTIGKQYLDGTATPDSKLNAYAIGNAGMLFNILSLKQHNIQFHLRCNNVFNRKYESNGWIYRFKSPSYNPVPDDPYSQSEGNSIYSQKGLYPQAGRNWMMTVSIKI